MIKVVLDTNIVVSAALKEGSLPALLLSLALRKEIQAFVSSKDRLINFSKTFRGLGAGQNFLILGVDNSRF